MTGIFGLREKDAGLLVRFAYRFSRRIFGKVPEPVGVTAHHRRDSEEGRLQGMEVHE